MRNHKSEVLKIVKRNGAAPLLLFYFPLFYEPQDEEQNNASGTRRTLSKQL